MLNLFKKKELQLEKKGYLLVVSLDQKEKTTINFVYSKESLKFIKKKIFDIGGILCDGSFGSIEEALNEIYKKKEFKRFLSGYNVNGIYYIELFIKRKEKDILSIESSSTKLYYVPSKMKLEIIE